MGDCIEPEELMAPEEISRRRLQWQCLHAKSRVVEPCCIAGFGASEARLSKAVEGW